MDAPKQALKKICEHRAHWMQAFKQPDMLPYLLCVEIGHEIVLDIQANNNVAQLKATFATIEQILANTKDIQVISLMVAGLFSAMQNKAYDDLNPPDQINNFLGRVSLQHWEDYIEGWTGKGIRTIEAWKNSSIE